MQCNKKCSLKLCHYYGDKHQHWPRLKANNKQCRIFPAQFPQSYSQFSDFPMYAVKCPDNPGFLDKLARLRIIFLCLRLALQYYVSMPSTHCTTIHGCVCPPPTCVLVCVMSVPQYPCMQCCIFTTFLPIMHIGKRRTDDVLGSQRSRSSTTKDDMDGIRYVIYTRMNERSDDYLWWFLLWMEWWFV